MIQGLAATVVYCGAHRDFPGLDQVNVEIPRALAGHGFVTVQLTADGHAANPVTVTLARNAYLNLGFESAIPGGVWNWYPSGTGFEVASDSAVKHSGDRSLRLRNVSAAAGQLGHAIFPGGRRARKAHAR